MTDPALIRQTLAEATHWRLAAEALADLDAIAAPWAWAALEDYLNHRVRGRLSDLVGALVMEGRALERMAGQGHDTETVRRATLRLRRRYLQVETVLDFYADAINTRTNPAMQALLRGYDALAADSMAATLAPLGIDAPAVLVYVDKGLGAAILRAGIRLWDHAHPSPAAAIKVTRHNLFQPTALLHESGHQVAYLAGWNDELAGRLYQLLAPHGTDLARMWQSWASEIAADVHAFVHAGWAPVFALANVVDGTSREVFRIRFGDPHPFPWIRVLFNVALCRAWYGPGPWDDVARAWQERHNPDTAGDTVRSLARASLGNLDSIVDLCTRQPMRAFRGVPITTIIDPRRTSPAAMKAFEAEAGGTLLTSSFLRRRHALRILAILSTRAVTDPGHAAAHCQTLRDWVSSVGQDTSAAVARTPA